MTAIRSLERKQLVKNLAERVEKDLVLLGCTAIEDNLQEKVPETIQKLLQANIKVWMITGDKFETADNIAACAGLTDSSTFIYRMKYADEDEFPKKVKELKRVMQQQKADVRKAIIMDTTKTSKLPSPEFIFGNDLRLQGIPELYEAVKIFRELLMEADTVICARTIPKHKAKLVKLVRSNNKVVLAIGDGANDVNMLTVPSVHQGSQRGSWAFRRRRHAGRSGKRFRTAELQIPLETSLGSWVLEPQPNVEVHHDLFLQELHLHSSSVHLRLLQLLLRHSDLRRKVGNCYSVGQVPSTCFSPVFQSQSWRSMTKM